VELSREAHAVLEHLVVKHRLEELVSESHLAKELGLSREAVSKAVDKLESLEGGRLVNVQPYLGGRKVGAKAAAWRVVKPDQVRNDMITVAKCVWEDKRVSYDDLARKTELPEDRMGIAAFNLEDEEAVELILLQGYPFGWVAVTSYTEKWLGEQEKN